MYIGMAQTCKTCAIQQASIKRSRIVIVLRAQYGANCSVLAPQHYRTKNLYRCYEPQYTAQYRHASRTIADCTSVLLVRASVCCVSSLTANKNTTLSPPHNTYRFSDLSSFLRLSCMSLLVLRGLDGLWSSQYSVICLEKGKTAQTLRLHVSHGKLRSTRGCLDTTILSVKFSYYATTHHTTCTFCAERNDCVHPTYFSFRTSVLRTQYDNGTGTFY